MSPRNSTNAALVCRGYRPTEDFAGLRVERGQQREGAMLKAVPLGPTGDSGSTGIKAVEGLERRFLVDGEDGRVIGRIDVPPNTSAALVSTSRSSDGHVAFESMRLQSGALPRSDVTPRFTV
jgi:hypothetical protein